VSELHAQFNRALFDDTIAENARLKAEVERLTKAGEDLVTWVLIMRHNNPNDIEDIRLVILNWNAAKEGKGQP
jgi:hypothetical protein